MENISWRLLNEYQELLRICTNLRIKIKIYLSQKKIIIGVYS